MPFPNFAAFDRVPFDDFESLYEAITSNVVVESFVLRSSAVQIFHFEWGEFYISIVTANEGLNFQVGDLIASVGGMDRSRLPDYGLTWDEVFIPGCDVVLFRPQGDEAALSAALVSIVNILVPVIHPVRRAFERILHNIPPAIQFTQPVQAFYDTMSPATIRFMIGQALLLLGIISPT